MSKKPCKAKKPLRDYTLNADEAGELLGYNPRYLKQLAFAKKLPGKKIRRRWWFSEKELDEWFTAETLRHQNKLFS